MFKKKRKNFFFLSIIDSVSDVPRLYINYDDSNTNVKQQ